jgi:hypothetical protein
MTAVKIWPWWSCKQVIAWKSTHWQWTEGKMTIAMRWAMQFFLWCPQYSVLHCPWKVLDIQYCSLYFYIHPYPLSLLPICTVHHNRAPGTSATPHVWNQNSLVDSKHVHLIPWDWTLVFKWGSTPPIPVTTLSYQTTTQRYKECSRFFSGTLPQFTAPSFLHSFHNCQNYTFLVPLTFL